MSSKEGDGSRHEAASLRRTDDGVPSTEADFYSIHMETLTCSVNLAANLSFPTSSFALFPCILASRCHKQPHLFPWQQQRAICCALSLVSEENRAGGM